MGYIVEDIEKLVITTYVAGETSLRDVAKACNTDHHRVKRILEKNGIEVVKAKTKPFSEEHKKRIGEASKGRVPWSKGKTMSRESLCKNMASHIRFEVSWEWYYSFTDIEKLKFLNMALTNRDDRWVVDTKWYVGYIERFYYDTQFNTLHDRWLTSGKDHHMRPSIDHITPRAKGGTNSLDNLQFLTWFENRCKNDMTQIEWDNLKLNMKDYLI